MADSTKQTCPFCMTAVHAEATVCPQCGAVKGIGMRDGVKTPLEVRLYAYGLYAVGSLGVMVMLYGFFVGGISPLGGFVFAAVFGTLGWFVHRYAGSEPNWHRRQL